MKLGAKQRRFVEEYLVDFNATQAAIRAGYSKKTARTIAAQNLAKRNIAEAVAKGMAKMGERAEVTAEALLAELDLIATARVSDVLKPGPDGEPVMRDFDEIDERGHAALAAMEITRKDIPDLDLRGFTVRHKFKLHAKLPAIIAALKRRGLGEDIDAQLHRVEYVRRVNKPKRGKRGKPKAGK